MSTLTTTSASTLAAVPSFTADQKDLIKRTIAKDATDDELALFLYQASRTGLDPLAKQIYFQKFKNSRGDSNISFITSIDGYRAIASRTGEHAGTDDSIFDDEHKPTKATVTVYRFVRGQRCPFTSTARWSEYYPGDSKGHMWRKMPCTMLAKCAEALALRKAFSVELSGVYTKDEMEQADHHVEPVKVTPIVDKPAVEPAKKAAAANDNNKIYQGSDEDVERLMAYLDKAGLSVIAYGDAVNAAMRGKPLSNLPKLVKMFLEKQEFDLKTAKQAEGFVIDGEETTE